MFCPNCKSEYRSGFTHCSDCGAELVERLEPVATNAPRAGDGPELLWTGMDAAAQGLIVNALDDAEIPHHESTRDVGALPGLSQPVYAIFIPSRHHDAARLAMEKAVRDLQDGPRQPDPAVAGSASGANPLEFEDQKDQDASAVPDDIVENYDPERATSEVWSGTDADMKDMLVACLRENGIGCELDANGNFRILVMPESEARAREIVREVLDAAQPE
jgi:hypothetical protein